MFTMGRKYLVFVIIIIAAGLVFVLSFEQQNEGWGEELESPVSTTAFTRAGSELIDSVYPATLALNNAAPEKQKGNEFKVTPNEPGALDEYKQVIVVYPDGERTVNLFAERSNEIGQEISRYAYYGFGNQGDFPPKGYYIWEFVEENGKNLFMAYYYDGFVLPVAGDPTAERQGDDLIASMDVPTGAKNIAFWISPLDGEEDLPDLEKAVEDVQEGERVSITFEDPPLEPGKTYEMNFHGGHELSYSLRKLRFVWQDPLEVITNWNFEQPFGAGYKNFGFPSVVHADPAPNSTIFSSPDKILIQLGQFTDESRGKIALYENGTLVKRGAITADESRGSTKLSIDLSGRKLSNGKYQMGFKAFNPYGDPGKREISGSYKFTLQEFDIDILDVVYCPGCASPCSGLQFPKEKK